MTKYKYICVLYEYNSVNMWRAERLGEGLAHAGCDDRRRRGHGAFGTAEGECLLGVGRKYNGVVGGARHALGNVAVTFGALYNVLHPNVARPAAA